MGSRISEWEARAMRKHDEMQAEVAREQGRQARARTQSEAGQARKRRSAEIRQVEQSRQWDRQREDIHPAEVLERLASAESKKLPSHDGSSAKRSGKWLGGNALFPLMDCPNLHMYDREQVKEYDTELSHLHSKAITVIMRRWLVRSKLCCS